MFFEQKQLNADLKIFLATIACLITIGLIFIYSSSSVYALAKYGTASFFVKKQFFGLLLGCIVLLICRFLPLELIKKTSSFLFFSSLALTALTLLPQFSERIHGSRRWLYVGSFGFQPSEMLKMALMIYLSYFLSKKEMHLRSFKYGYLPFLTILFLVSLVLLKQPDFGMTFVLVTTALLLLFIMQIKGKHLIVTASALVPIMGGLIYMRPYRWQRVLTFLDPWKDPQGSGFQIIQSLIAIGSGSLLGLGISNSKQKFFYLPMQHTDFIFSIIAEETGFIGSFFLITLYMFFLYFGIRIAWYLKDQFSSLLTLSFVLLTTLQAILNLAVTLGLVPTKGMGLPFVSYGLSGLLCNLAMVGLIMNCVRENKQ